MRKVLNSDEANQILSPYLDDIEECFIKGFEDYLEIRRSVDEKGNGVSYKMRTRASIIHDHIKAHLNIKFQDVQEVYVGEWNGIFGLKIEDTLFLRIKKLKKGDYSVSSFMTKQTKKYLNQSQIPGFPESPTFLVAGYIPDPSWTSISGIYITCPDGSSSNHWVMDIGHYTIEQGVIDFPVQEEKAPDSIKKKRVKVKEKSNIIKEAK